MRKYQIFISSTFDDLKDARRVVIEQLLNLGHIPVGMELFQAGNESQWEYIKRRVLECDYYLLIVGDRYGSCLSDGTSYTEREYRFAVDHGVPVASFLLSREARAKLPRGFFETDAATINRLEEFRRLAQTRMVQFWNEQFELAAKISSALPELIKYFPRPGLVPFGALPLPDRLRHLSLSADGGDDVSMYEVLRGELSDARVEASGLQFMKGDDHLDRISLEVLFPDKRKIIWEIDDIVRLIFAARKHLLTKDGLLEEDFNWICFVDDLVRKHEVNLKQLLAQYEAEWCQVTFRGLGLYGLAEDHLKKAGLLQYVRQAPGRDYLRLTLTGRLLIAALAKIPGVIDRAADP